MIQEFIESKVVLMTSNSESYTFGHSEKDWQNINADSQILPCVYLDMPVQYKTKTFASGYKEKTYICTALFLFRTDLGNKPSEQYDIFKKAELAQFEFELLIDADNLNVKEWTVGTCTQVQHLFDTDVSGVIMPFEITFRNTNSVCLP